MHSLFSVSFLAKVISDIDMCKNLVNLKAITRSLSSRCEVHMRSVYIFWLVLWRQNAFETLPKLMIHPWQPFLHYNTDFRNAIFFTFLDKLNGDRELAWQIFQLQEDVVTYICVKHAKFWAASLEKFFTRSGLAVSFAVQLNSHLQVRMTTTNNQICPLYFTFLLPTKVLQG